MDKMTPGLTWDQVCADRNLGDLPYKTETNLYGQIVMSHTSFPHGRFQFKIAQLLARLLRAGETATETAIRTPDGTKVADVTWASRAFARRYDSASNLPEAPSVCVEVLSPTNSRGEIAGKRELYFERGAREVWVCDLDGKMTFYNPDSPLERSGICPRFPSLVSL